MISNCHGADEIAGDTKKWVDIHMRRCLRGGRESFASASGSVTDLVLGIRLVRVTEPRKQMPSEP
jgi:hypothetical protein